MVEVKERIINRDILCLKSSFQVLVKNIKLFKILESKRILSSWPTKCLDIF
jgi:hypothetical protein